MFCLVLIPFIPAAVDTVDVDDVFQVNETINYAKGCFNNGSYCSASAICNYTMFSPTKQLLLNNVQATNNISNHNYTLYFPEMGTYQIDMVCIDGGNKGSNTFHAQITGSGFNSNLGFLLAIFLIPIAILALGFKLEDHWLIMLGSFALFIVGLYILLNGIADIRNLAVTRTLGIITLMIGAYISVRTGYELTQM